MTYIITIANQKGGVGKTTTVINLGVALAHLNKKTLLIDLDPQGALSVGLGINMGENVTTIYDVLMDEAVAISQAIRPVQTYLDLVPADIDLAAAEIELIPELRRELILRNELQILDGWYDYVLIDCPPSLNLLTVNALCAADGVIVPMQCEFFAIRMVGLLIDSINRTRDRLNPDLELLGILATMYSTGTVHAREVWEEIQALYGDKVFETIIYKSIRFAEASVAKKAMVEYAGRHKGAQAYLELAETVVERTTALARPATSSLQQAQGE
jgi:chromosome partitioning protein